MDASQSRDNINSRVFPIIQSMIVSSLSIDHSSISSSDLPFKTSVLLHKASGGTDVPSSEQQVYDSGGHLASNANGQQPSLVWKEMNGGGTGRK